VVLFSFPGSLGSFIILLEKSGHVYSTFLDAEQPLPFSILS